MQLTKGYLGESLGDCLISGVNEFNEPETRHDQVTSAARQMMAFQVLSFLIDIAFELIG